MERDLRIWEVFVQAIVLAAGLAFLTALLCQCGGEGFAAGSLAFDDAGASSGQDVSLPESVDGGRLDSAILLGQHKDAAPAAMATEADVAVPAEPAEAGVPCGANALCVPFDAGDAAPFCLPGTRWCAEGCTDLNSDVDNCAICGRRCVTDVPGAVAVCSPTKGCVSECPSGTLGCPTGCLSGVTVCP